MRVATRDLACVLAAAAFVMAATVAVAEDSFEGYDFGHVVERLENSVNPLQQEMDASFQPFIERTEEAERLLEEGRTDEAVEVFRAALEGVREARDRVLEPMWEGQEFLDEQIGVVRSRLAKALEAARVEERLEDGREFDEATEARLDHIARGIAQEGDPTRQSRLVGHYRMIRSLAEIRQQAQHLSPDQRRLWLQVLQILEEAAVAHQQVLMGSEVLFAHFDATSANLDDFLVLLETVQGASRLMGMVRGAGDLGEGMTAFAERMDEFQTRMSGFNESVEEALQVSMLGLEAEMGALEAEGAPDLIRQVSASWDDELAARIETVTQEPAD